MQATKSKFVAAGALALAATFAAAPMASAANGTAPPSTAPAQFITGALEQPQKVALTGKYDPSLYQFPTTGPLVFNYSLNYDTAAATSALGSSSQGMATWTIYEMPSLERVGSSDLSSQTVPAEATVFETGTVDMSAGYHTVTSTKTPVIDQAQVEALANIQVPDYTHGTWDELSKSYFLTLNYAGNAEVAPLSTYPSYISSALLDLPSSSYYGVKAGAPCLAAGAAIHPRLVGQPINYCPTRTPRPTTPPVATPTPVVTPEPVVTETPAAVVVEEAPAPEQKPQPLIDTAIKPSDSNSGLYVGAGIFGIAAAVALTLAAVRIRKAPKE